MSDEEHTDKSKQVARKGAFLTIQGTTPSNTIVGVGNLRVLLSYDDAGHWFAQGLEIDYAAQGTSVEDVQKRFEDGLTCTIREHLRVFNDVATLVSAAPDEAWRELLMDCVPMSHSQVSFHPLKFSAVDYYTKKAA